MRERKYANEQKRTAPQASEEKILRKVQRKEKINDFLKKYT